MQKAWLVFGCIVVLLLVVWFLLSGSPVAAPLTNLHEGPVSFTVLTAGAYAAQFPEEKNYRIKTQEEFTELWALLHEGETPPIPDVDFREKEVLAVFSGERPTGGYRVSVKEVIDVGGVRTVTIVHAVPDESCMVAQALTSPFELVVVPAGEHTLTHEDEIVTTPCS